MVIRKRLVLFLLLSSLAFGEEPGIFPGTDLVRILNKPQVIYSSVTWERAEDKSRWITMDVDIHVFSDISFDVMRTAAKELENYPRIFKRLKNAYVTRSDDGVFLEMFVSVGLMGITYDTDYIMRVTEPVNSPTRFMLDYAWYAGDGLVMNDAHGQWYLESASADDITGTYIRYTVHGVVLKKYPLQGEIMKMFVDLEHADIMNQFLRSVSQSRR